MNRLGQRSLLEELEEASTGLVSSAVVTVTAEGAAAIRSAIPVGIPKGPLTQSEAARLLQSLGQATAIFNELKTLGEVTGASVGDRFRFEQSRQVLSECLTRANQLSLGRGGFGPTVQMLNEVVAGVRRVEITEGQLLAIREFVNCALEVQQKVRSGRVTRAAAGTGIPFILLALGAFA